MKPNVVIVYGRHGSGATLLARAFHEVFATGTYADVLRIFEAARMGSDGRPHLRAPHHTTSTRAMLGGFNVLAVPGEVSLAHRGVLLLDELAEFRASTLESVAHALVRGAVTIGHGLTATTFAAQPMLTIGVVRPCFCVAGADACQCDPNAVRRMHDRVRTFCAIVGVSLPSCAGCAGGAS